MFRRDPVSRALAQASALLGRDLTPLRGEVRALYRRGGVLALSRGEQRLLLPLGGVPADGLFELASVTKPFTAALAGALASAGRLAWDAPLRELGGPFRRLPPFLTPATLATHTAGLPTHPARTALTTLTRFHDPYGGMKAADALSSARRWASGRQAGRFGYSNLGTGVLALACAFAAGEEVSAQGYGQALSRYVTGPLNLSGVSLTPAEGVVPPTGLLGPTGVTGFGPLAGAGGLYGRAADLLVFGEAHLRGGMGTGWAQVHRPPGLPPHLTGVTAGWLESRGAYWHDGVARGTRSGLGVAPEPGGPDSGVVVALLVRGGMPLVGPPLGPRGGVASLLLALLENRPPGPGRSQPLRAPAR